MSAKERPSTVPAAVEIVASCTSMTPSVSVPVLSKTTTSTLRATSRTLGSRNTIPRAAPRPDATSNATGVANADTGGGIIRQVIRTIGLQKKAKYNVTGIVMDGATWANILTYTTTAGEFTQPIGVVTISNTGQLMVCGIPVYTASWVGGDEVLLGDWNYFEIIQSEALSLGFFEQDGDNVKKNKITARIEASVAFAMLDPKAFVVMSVESVS